MTRGPIVVGTDGTEASRAAVAQAALVACASNRRVILVFARRSALLGAVGVFSPGALERLYRAFDAEQTVAQAYGISELDPVGVNWTFETREGQPAVEIVRVATESEADTIVVGSRRQSAMGELRLPSVASQIFYRWPWTLLIVRNPGSATKIEGNLHRFR